MLPLFWSGSLASVDRSPAEATISLDFRSGVGSVVPGIGSGRKFVIKNARSLPLMRGYISSCVSRKGLLLRRICIASCQNRFIVLAKLDILWKL